MTKDLDKQLLELQAEKKRLEEEFNKKQDSEIQALLKEKKELELAVNKKQEEEIKQLVKEKQDLEKEILTEQQKQEKLKKLFSLPKFDSVDKNVKTTKSVDEQKLLNTLIELTGAVNKFQTDEIAKTNITENDFDNFVSKQQLVSKDLASNIQKVFNTNSQPIRSLQQEQIYKNANIDIKDKDVVVKELTKQAQSITEDIVSGEISLDKLTTDFNKFKQLTTLQLQSLGGGGSTKISNMDDVDISGQQDGFALKYNASTGKYDFGEVASDLSSVSQNIIPDGNGTRDIGSSSKVFNNGYFNNVYVSGSTLEVSNDAILKGDIQLGVNTGDSTEDTITVNGRFVSSLEPLTTLTHDLGSPNRRWRDIYLSGNTIDLAGATISGDGTGAILISATGATLPVGSKVGTKAIAQSDAKTGIATKDVPLFTKAGGLSTAATTFTMAAGSSNASVFTDFTKANGTQQSKFELFSF
jgi:hypothetical protein|tara:strand:- start:313 stop:1719 length:1407 start_codon:yes stop_codon:yes gene_type:complete